MSYINDALRRAQKDKDNRYKPFGGIIAPGPETLHPMRRRKRRVVWGGAVALVLLLFAAGLFFVYGPQPPARPKGATPPPAAVAEKAVPKDVEKAGGPPEGQPAGEADLRYQEALAAQRGGDLRRAEALYDKSLALDPGHVRTLNNLGVIYMAQKKREKAIALFSRAIALKRDYVDPYYNLACLYAQTNEIDESLWYLRVAAAIDRGVMDWVMKDADMKDVVASPEFKRIMGGQKN